MQDKELYQRILGLEPPTIQMIKKRAFGFRSFHNFRIAILFRCGGLQLHP